MATRRKRGRREPWGEFETLALMEFYPRHGPQWEGWDDVLPNRTRHAIIQKAAKLDLKAPIVRSKRNVEDDDDEGSMTPHEYERIVRNLMGEGLSPTQIDQMMHWVPRTAANILKEIWARDKEKEQ